jgi:frataxin
MDESAFETLADRTLADLQTRIEDAAEDADVDLRSGILTVEFDDGRQYVINKHMPNRQIWLSSPISGAMHFNHDPATGKWRSTRGSEVLHEVLAAELGTITGHTVTFD